MERLLVNNITIDIVRKDIKNIHLAVYPPSGRVRLAVPMAMTEDSMRLFAISKLSWITRNQRKFEQQERMLPREYKERESHYFQGRRYLLNIVITGTRPKIALKGKKTLELHVNPDTPATVRHKMLREWYRTQLKKQIPVLISKWENILKVQVHSWRVRQMKTKWGGRNEEKKSIWINLELAKKPVRCLEYIIVHEMVHLLQKQHNAAFLNQMNTYLPKWKQLKNELNKLPVSHSDWKY